MPRYDDDEDDDRPPRSRRRSRDDDEEPDRPARGRRRPRDDDEDLPPPRKKSNLGLVLGIVAGVLFLLCAGGGVGGWYFLREVGGAATEVRETETNVRQIGLAMHNHSDARGFLPNNSYDPQGRPLLSWRVHILPFVEQESLYRQFNLNEPWDGPTNRRLVDQMPRVYGSPKANALAGPGKTFYRGFSHPGGVFEKPGFPGRPQGFRMTEVTDGLSNTIFVVEAGEAVEWTRPDDLDWSPGRPRPALGKPGAAMFMAVLGDGSFRRIRTTIDDTTLRNLIGRNDGMVLQGGWD